MRILSWILLPLAAIWVAGCGDESTGTMAVPTGDVEVRMDFTRAGGFYDAPFPSTELQLESGHVDVSRFPNPDRVPIVDQTLALIARDANGFALTGGIYFSLSGAIDRTRLPDVNGSRAPNARVFLISVDD